MKWTEEYVEELADDLVSWMESDETNLWYKDWALKKHIHVQRLSEWASKYPKFNDALNQAKAIQESRMTKEALTQKLNHTMCIFLLKCNHGYIDRQTVDQTVTKKTDRSELDAVLDRITDRRDKSDS